MHHLPLPREGSLHLLGEEMDEFFSLFVKLVILSITCGFFVGDFGSIIFLLFGLGLVLVCGLHDLLEDEVGEGVRGLLPQFVTDLSSQLHFFTLRHSASWKGRHVGNSFIHIERRSPHVFHGDIS